VNVAVRRYSEGWPALFIVTIAPENGHLPRISVGQILFLREYGRTRTVASIVDHLIADSRCIDPKPFLRDRSPESAFLV
jgi:hypothetical protein